MELESGIAHRCDTLFPFNGYGVVIDWDEVYETSVNADTFAKACGLRQRFSKGLK